MICPTCKHARGYGNYTVTCRSEKKKTEVLEKIPDYVYYTDYVVILGAKEKGLVCEFLETVDEK